MIVKGNIVKNENNGKVISLDHPLGVCDTELLLEADNEEELDNFFKQLQIDHQSCVPILDFTDRDSCNKLFKHNGSFYHIYIFYGGVFTEVYKLNEAQAKETLDKLTAIILKGSFYPED